MWRCVLSNPERDICREEHPQSGLPSRTVLQIRIHLSVEEPQCRLVGVLHCVIELSLLGARRSFGTSNGPRHEIFRPHISSVGNGSEHLNDVLENSCNVTSGSTPSNQDMAETCLTSTYVGQILFDVRTHARTRGPRPIFAEALVCCGLYSRNRISCAPVSNREVISDALRQPTPLANFAHVDEKSQGTLKHLRHFSVMPSQVLLRNSGLVSDSARLI